MGRLQQWKGSTGATFPSTFTSDASGQTTTKGSVIFVGTLIDGLASSQLLTMTDDANNVYQRVGTVNIASVGQLDAWICFNNQAATAGLHVIAGNFGSTTGAFEIEEWSSLGALIDQLQPASDNTAASNIVVSGSTGVTQYVTEAVFFLHSASLASAGFTAASGYSNLNQTPSNNSTLGLQTKVTSGKATQSGVTSFVSPADWLSLIVTIPFYYGGTTTSTSSTSASTFSTSSTSSSISSTSSSISSTSSSTSTSSTSVSTSSTTFSTSSTSNSTSSTSVSSTSSSTSQSSTSSSISSTSASSTSQSSTSSSTSQSSTSSSFSSTSSSFSSTSSSISSTSQSSTSSSSSTSTTTVPPGYDYTYQDESSAITQIQGQGFGATGTWKCPVGVTSVRVDVWGGGGSGGPGNGVTGGAGGGGGAYARANAMTVVPGTIYTVTVGALSNGIGNLSWFNTALSVMANGGGQGTNAVVGAGGIGGIGDITHNGGTGGAIATTGGAGGGGGAGSEADGSTGGVGLGTGNLGGAGGAYYGGNGGPGSSTSLVGADGSNYGAGGGGSGSAIGTNSNGARGAVFISWVTNTSTAPPTTAADLLNRFSVPNYSDVSVDDGGYFIERGAKFLIREYSQIHQNNTDNIFFTWKGRSTLSTLISPILIQIYNYNSAAWETLATQNAVPADTDFQVQVSQATNTSNYYSANNVVTVRSYQQVN